MKVDDIKKEQEETKRVEELKLEIRALYNEYAGIEQQYRELYSLKAKEIVEYNLLDWIAKNEIEHEKGDDSLSIVNTKLRFNIYDGICIFNDKYEKKYDLEFDIPIKGNWYITFEGRKVFDLHRVAIGNVNMYEEEQLQELWSKLTNIKGHYQNALEIIRSQDLKYAYVNADDSNIRFDTFDEIIAEFPAS